MLAHLTRLLTCALLAAFAWLVARGAMHGWTAGVVLGLVALVLWHPALLGLEFLFMRHVTRQVNGTRLPWRPLLRAWLGEWWASTVTFGWRLPWRARAVPDHLPPAAQGRRGVVFVHGYVCNRGLWNPWLARLRALDRPFVAVDLEPVFGPIDAYARVVEAAVRRVEAATGVPPLVVAHSMGGLAARAWLRAHAADGAAQRVAGILTIGTPHRGTWLAALGLSPNARQMRQGSPWMRELDAAGTAPQAARFACWWSDCDQIVFPPPTAVLPGAQARALAGVAHVALCLREEIWQDVLARLDGGSGLQT
jgi:pimeloyl-ACP methyl ester carboxylesterase